MVTTRPPKTIVKPTALGLVANTDTKLLIYGLFQKGRVLAQDGVELYGKGKIGVRVGRVLNKYKVGKHFKLNIRDDSFSFEIDDTKVAAEAAVDGIYVIRTT